MSFAFISLQIACFQWNRHPFRSTCLNFSRTALCNVFLKSEVTEKGSILHSVATITQFKACQYIQWVFCSHQDIQHRYIHPKCLVEGHDYQALINFIWNGLERTINIKLNSFPQKAPEKAWIPEPHYFSSLFVSLSVISQEN